MPVVPGAPNLWSWLSRASKPAVAAAALAFPITFLILAIQRIGYPFHINLLEGAAMTQVNRLLSGQGFYVEPSLEHISFIYQPLYYYLATASAAVLGETMMAFRLVSLLAAIGTLLWIFLTIRQITRAVVPAILGTCLFAAGYGLVRGLFDVARVDMLLTFWLIGALYFLLRESRTAGLLAGLLFSAAFMTKQTALIAALPMIAYLLLFDRSRALPFLAGAVIPSAVAVGLLAYASDGWYLYYVFEIPGQHRLWINSHVLDFWLVHMAPLAIAGAMSIVLFAFPPQDRSPLRRTALLLALAMSYLGMSWAATINIGANVNVLMPAVGCVAVLFGLAVHRIETLAEMLPSRTRESLHLCLYAAVALQFFLLIYDPRSFLMSQRDVSAGNKLVNMIEEAEPPIYLPTHNYLSVMAGRAPLMHWMALCELSAGCYGGGDPAAHDRILHQLSQAVRKGEIGSIVLTENAAGRGVPERLLGKGVALTLIDELDYDDKDDFSPEGPEQRPSLVFWAKAKLGGAAPEADDK